MMRSMFSGISGLKGFQSSMDVIGNNIANVNTVGFKVSRTTFQSMLNQTVVGAKSPEAGGRGGTNSMQIGLGSQIGSIGKIMTQGSFQNTGKKTDLGLQGDGFFVLSDGIQDFYTRSGNIQLDENGNFIQPSTGLKLQGWLSKVDPKSGQRYLDLDKPPSDLFIQAGMTMGAKATTNMDLGGNLNADVGIEPLTITVKNPDDPTKVYKVRFTFEKMAPFDTKRLFSSSTIKYTWKAELVDWNAESPSELPELNHTTGMVELNQFGQIEKFFRYPTTMLNGSVDDAFNDSILECDAEKTWFNYSPTGTDPIVKQIKDIFDPDDDGLLDKIVTRASYTPDNTAANRDYTFTTTLPTASAGGTITKVDLSKDVTSASNSWRVASGDTVNISYYCQESINYLSTKSKYNISGPILNSEGEQAIGAEDILVAASGTAGKTYLVADQDFTYDTNTGNVNIIDTSNIGTGYDDKIILEYCTKDSFVGNGTDTSWQLSKKAIQRPDGGSASNTLGGASTMDVINGTSAQNTLLEIDMQFTIDDSSNQITFNSNYGAVATDSVSSNATFFNIEYANPDNPQEFNTIDVGLGLYRESSGTVKLSSEKASVSIPKTGDLKFFDKNDTQNYVIGDYVSPKYTTSTRVYDSLGSAYTVFLEFQKLSENQWAWKASEESGIPVSYVDDDEKTYSPSPNDLTSIVGGVVEFDSAGRVASLKAIRQDGLVEDDINIVRIKFDPGIKIDDGAAPPPEEGATEVSAQLDFSELVQFSSEFSTTITEQDGNAMGTLQNFAINNIGEVVGTFSNGKSESLGRIAISIFNNPAGLSEIGNTLYQVSANSGSAQIGLAGVGGRGTISPGVLEMSNVDLAEEFTGMVIVQRAFQANARTVTTVDQILQELVNLKR